MFAVIKGDSIYTAQTPWTNIVISPANPVIITGANEAFTATGYFSDGSSSSLAPTNGLVWSSRYPSIATINTNGVATGLTSGTTTITAMSGSVSNSTILTVVAPPSISHTSFSLSTNYNVGNNPVSVMVFTNVNGKLDMAYADFYGNPGLTIMTNDGSGNFSIKSSITLATGSQPNWLTAADMNGDGKMDLVCLNYGVNGLLTVLTNDGTGGFVIASTIIPALRNGLNSVTAADVNGDGKIDLIATASSTSGHLLVLTNDGHGGFVLACSPGVGSGPNSPVVFTNMNGQINIACGSTVNSTLTLLTNQGNGVFVVSSYPTGGNNPSSLVAADVNGDGKMDLVCADTGDGTLTVLTNDGSGGFVIATNLASGTHVQNNGTYVTATDVNGDGKADLVSVNNIDGTLTVYTNNGSGGFALVTNIYSGNQPRCVATGDVNGDGKVDLISANFNNSTISVLLNTSVFPSATLVTNIIVSPAGATIAVSSNMSFTATGYFNDGSSHTLTTNLTWASSSVNVAAINTNGLATGLAQGVTTITATSGSVSNSTTLTVVAPPSISVQPTNDIVYPNGQANLSVAATGGGLSYQWRFNGTNINGATGAIYTITNISSANIGVYTVVISNLAGSIVSQAAMVGTTSIQMYAGIAVNGPLGSNFVIQSTANLFNGWTTRTNLALPSQPYIYIDYNSPTNPQQFYRALPQ